MTNDNATIVLQALGSLLENGNADALADRLRDDFIHHRPDTESTKHEWLASVGSALNRLADLQVEIRHVVADTDQVVVHSVRRLPDGPEIAVVDILRLDDGLVVEAWEIIEPTARAQANLRWWEAGDTAA